MRPRALTELVVSLFLCALAAGAAGGDAGTVLRVVDGDTLVVRVGGLGLWAGSLPAPAGRTATLSGHPAAH